MRKRSKRYKQARSALGDMTTPRSLPDAIKALKSLPSTKFDEAVEIAMKLGIDPKKGDQLVRGTLSLPNGIGREKKVICFAEGDVAEKAKEAGAIEVGSKDLAKKIQDGWLDFDVAVAHQSMMPVVSKLGRVLGPAGKMPSPKTGTVTTDVETAIKEFAAGKIEFRNDRDANVHAVMGKKSFSEEKLLQNIEAFIDQIKAMKPAAAKGIYFQSMALTTTMGPGIPLETP